MTKKLFSLVITLFLCAVTAGAQTANGTIKGRVIDPNGLILPGATLLLEGSDLQGQKTATSDDEGNYVFQGLPPGTYTLQVRRSGFKTLLRPNLMLRAGQTLTLDLSLQVGDVSETVEIQSSGENTPIIDTSNPEQKFNVSGEFVNKLPMSSRQNWESVWFLVPGAVTIGRGGPDGVNFDPQINGASERSNVYKLDGFDIGNSFTNQGWTTQFSTEAIQDVQIKTTGGDASTPLGQGGFINVITKSGGNRYSGSAAVFMQPRRFNWSIIPGGTPADQ
jgi:hypothetical protein